MIDLENLKKKKILVYLTTEEQEYLIKNFPWCKTMQEAVFCLRENITQQPTCQYKICNIKATFNRYGYKMGCCKDHNIRLTNLKKFGVENVKQNKEIIEKAKNTYNSKSPEEKKEIQHRKEIGMLKKYGVVNAGYATEVKEKISNKNKANAVTRMIKLKQNNQEKYGVDNVFQLQEIKEKSKETLNKKYGVENPSQAEEIKLKKENTCFENYGVNFPAQDTTIFEKQQKYRWKNYTMPSGKTVKIQGYENLALDILLKTYGEDDLIVERKSIPKIKYGTDLKHHYIADIFIPKENRFIEVKSSYTFKKYLVINLLKEQAAIDAGYVFDFMILTDDGDIVEKESLINI